MANSQEEAIKEYLHGTQVRSLSNTDTFNFSCKQCGKCCTNRVDDQSIIMNPHDIFKLAKGLGIETRDVFMQYGDHHVGHSSYMPLVYIKNSQTVFDKEQKCVFKKGNGCGVHDYKPVACSLYPLGRSSSFEKGDERPEVKVEYFVQDVNCDGGKPTLRNKHTVDEWLPNRAVEEEYFTEFNSFMEKLLRTHYRDFMEDERVSSDLKNKQLDMTAQLLYIGYDTSQEFLPQFKQRCEDILAIQEKISELYESHYIRNPEPTLEEEVEVEQNFKM